MSGGNIHTVFLEALIIQERVEAVLTVAGSKEIEGSTGAFLSTLLAAF